ncbi:ABC transporter permease [Tepidibacter thalassicus]|uniref:Putative ABC transport system permease protein n=1 Tax=Tepidibacter thalassicus DSM 15285 TaxID=1123350 RepID=A0A1M5SMH1_9FIRM|nr:FtsX-like permease family protein [Tepidibacter thalassicus]SHH39113.1 putative ABC transport system permease protein [Tepidibacter thalassicus DSM 15285]
MTLFDICIKNIKRNFRNYFIYFMSIVFNVIIYFTFVSIRFNEQILRFLAGEYKILVLFKFASILIAIFSLIFIWYSTSFFIKKRKKEIGIYSLLGVKKRQIGRMLFYENVIMGIMALGIGLLLGSIFCKLFIMILFKFINFLVEVKFTVNFKAVLSTVVTFGVLFLITSIYGYTIIYKFSLIELFKAENVAEKEPRSSMIMALISILIIGIGYIVGLNVSIKTFLVNTGVVLMTSVVGTFMFFNYFLIFVMKVLKKNKRRYYKGINIIGINQILYRIKSNSRTLSIIAILSAVILTSIGITYTLYYTVSKEHFISYPFSYSYITNNEVIDEKVENIIAKYPKNKLVNSVEEEFIRVYAKCSDYKLGKVYLISESKFNKIAKIRGLKDRVHLDDDSEVVLLNYTRFRKNVKGKSVELLSNDKKQEFKVVDHKLYYAMNRYKIESTFVVKDSIYNEFYDKNNIDRIKGYKIKNELDSKELTKEIIRVVPSDVELSYCLENINALMLIGMLLFVGVFLGLVFLIASGSVIYFKQLTEANEEKGRYLILKNIGVSKEEIKVSIAKQMGVIFGLPLIVGIAHSLVAIIMNYKLFNLNMISPVILIIGSYILIYLVYYFLTINSYNKIVNSKTV